MTDVCLLLEGTYPYVAGGVSSWVHDLISSLDDMTFSVIYLGAHRPGTKKMHYKMPQNVLDFQEYYLFDYRIYPKSRYHNNKQDYQIIEDFFRAMKVSDTSYFNELYRIAGNSKTRKVDQSDFVHSYPAWEVLVDIYSSESKGTSFIDYFWSWRFIYLPFFTLLKVPLLPARIYHTISTGYAGLLGCLCKKQFNRPLILTEHGIYTRERKIEIAQADWIYSEDTGEIKVIDEEEFFRKWWNSLFSFYSHLTYEHADEIISLYEGNRQVQVEEGADVKKTRIIPNGVDYAQLSSLPKEKQSKKLRVGFMGRVVPIKDVKTFIRACKIIYEKIKDVEFFIMGPLDEDKEYYNECFLLVQREGLEGVVHFTGKIKVTEYYPHLDIIVLTSISEAQPIVILESFACGIPVVSSDVGSCKELLYGRTADDQLLGKAGTITPLYDPLATANAVVKILTDQALYLQMSETARQRVKKYFQKNHVWAAYQQLYTHYIEQVRWN